MRSGLIAASSLVLLSCESVPPVSSDAAGACAALARPIEAAVMGLPSGPVTIESATNVAASPLAINPKPPFTPAPVEIAVVPALPDHCRVIGSIAPIDPKAPPIRFQVNLPAQWNRAAVQLGGGGFNGVLVTGLALPPSARPDKPGPLARGYVTFGTDSGHQNSPGVPLQAFALNDEALENFAFASYKKVRDVAVELMFRRYGFAPERVYYIGSSEGGREGLAMAQRFPEAYDGIFSRVPVINWVGLQSAGARIGGAQFGAGWIPPQSVKLVHEAVLAACDGRDGIADRIVSDYEGCLRAFDPGPLQCVAAETSGCLTAAQMRALAAIYIPFTFDFALANGVRSYPGWGVGGENASGGGPVGGWVSWQTGAGAPTLPPGPTASRAWLYGSGAVQYFFARDANFDPRQFDPNRFSARLREVSALMDATDPDLRPFAARGGKLIISEHMADYAQSPYAGIAYWKSVAARMGLATVDEFMRLYVTPGADHMGQGAPSNVDMLEVLADWVERGRAPGSLVQVEQTMTPPFEVVRSRPMCRYPAFPLYRRGEPRSADSFECRQ